MGKHSKPGCVTVIAKALAVTVAGAVVAAAARRR